MIAMPTHCTPKPVLRSPPQLMNQATEKLKQKAIQLGFDLAGVATLGKSDGVDRLREWIKSGKNAGMSYMSDRLDAYEDPNLVLDSVQCVLMLGTAYQTIDPALPSLGEGGFSRYAWGTDYHNLIRKRLKSLSAYHRELFPAGHARGVVDTAPVLERYLARKAGLGWIGKNNLLINDRFGSWIFLSGLLSTEPLTPDEVDFHKNSDQKCGSCQACLNACPTGALVAPCSLDACRCLSYWLVEHRGPIPLELRPLVDNRLFGCDTCQAVCPANREAQRSKEKEFFPRPGQHHVQLIEILQITDDQFQRRFAGTPIKRLGREGLLRNAAIVAGNRPTPSLRGPLTVLLDDPSETVRDAAAWALKQ